VLGVFENKAFLLWRRTVMVKFSCDVKIEKGGSKK